jgi:hypothetical protein
MFNVARVPKREGAEPKVPKVPEVPEVPEVRRRVQLAA